MRSDFFAWQLLADVFHLVIPRCNGLIVSTYSPAWLCRFDFSGV